MAVRAAIVGWEDSARKRLYAATDALAARIGATPVEREARVSRLPEPTPRTVGDLEATAILSEAVVKLTQDVDELRRGAVKKGARS